MVLGKLPEPGRPINLDYSSARAYSACNRSGWGLFGKFYLAYHFSSFFLSLSLSLSGRRRDKNEILSQRAVKYIRNKQTTTNLMCMYRAGHGIRLC